MGRKHETFNKKEVRLKKEKKRKEKEQKKQERKENRGGSSLDDMIAYVDEFGNITSTPPDPSQKKEEINLEDIMISVPKSLGPDPDEIIRKGVVTFFNDSKGFGFIKDTLTQQDIFVHVNSLEEPIKENNKVTFEIIKGVKGPNAVHVKIDRE